MRLWELVCLGAGMVAAKSIYDYVKAESKAEREKAIAIAAIALGVIPVVMDWALVTGKVE